MFLGLPRALSWEGRETALNIHLIYLLPPKKYRELRSYIKIKNPFGRLTYAYSIVELSKYYELKNCPAQWDTDTYDRKT